ncbi:hypothetical protein N9D31_02350 [Oligoflexaceae bacterium]|nr:hypothetical protein [Oligoflexaceae bacterium]
MKQTPNKKSLIADQIAGTIEFYNAQQRQNPSLAYIKELTKGFETLLEKADYFQGCIDTSTVPLAADFLTAVKKSLCFSNAQRFCDQYPEAQYYEGYTIWSEDMEFPILHAWVVLDGRVIEFTRNYDEGWSETPPTYEKSDSQYFGIRVPSTALSAFKQTDYWHSSLLSRVTDHFDALWRFPVSFMPLHLNDFLTAPKFSDQI